MRVWLSILCQPEGASAGPVGTAAEGAAVQAVAEKGLRSRIAAAYKLHRCQFTLHSSRRSQDIPYLEGECRSPAGVVAGSRGHRKASARTCLGVRACNRAGRRRPWEERRSLHDQRNRRHHHDRSRHLEDQCPKPYQREFVGRRTYSICQFTVKCALGLLDKCRFDKWLSWSRHTRHCSWPQWPSVHPPLGCIAQNRNRGCDQCRGPSRRPDSPGVRWILKGNWD